jgi:hypothetical protein
MIDDDYEARRKKIVIAERGEEVLRQYNIK